MAISDFADIIENLAGSHYREMNTSKSAAFELVLHHDRNVQIAAIHTYLSRWRSREDDPRFVCLCRDLARSSHDESVRIHALRAIGQLDRGCANTDVSVFLAKLIKDNLVPDDVRFAAYQSLREVQLGIQESDVITASMSLVQTLNSRYPDSTFNTLPTINELHFHGRFTDEEVRSFKRIDWELVNRILGVT